MNERRKRKDIRRAMCESNGNKTAVKGEGNL